MERPRDTAEEGGGPRAERSPARRSRDEIGSQLEALEPELRARVRIQPQWRRSLDVDDVLQVSFLEAYLRGGQLNDPSPAAFRAWMQRVVENNLRDAIRGLERDKRPDLRRQVTQGPAGESARTLLGRLAQETGTVSAPAVLQEQLGQLQEALRRLPASYREVVQLLDLEELEVTEVAERMERSRGAVHLLRSRAHDRLRELLGQDD